ncbi:MAG: hypothetical protein GWN58_42120, partial [Anaerolineae bacterium]|nr:hypothetical protein [Anaerolineae bacterium]
MAVKSTPVLDNYISRTFVQTGGPGNAFDLYDCQALTEWTRTRADTVRIKVKSLTEYGKFTTKATVLGAWEDPTGTVIAYTPEQLDWLLDQDCPIDFQAVWGRCNSPSDLSSYIKIRHVYQATITEQGESGVDFLGEEEAAGIEQTVSWSAEDVVTIVQVSAAQQRQGVTETQA